MKKAILFSAVLLPLGAMAGDLTEIGKTTRDVLEMQRSGENAAEVRPMLKDVAERGYERYLKSFEHPIPDQFERRSGFSAD